MIKTDLNSPELQLYAKLNENFAKMIEIAKEEIKKNSELGKYFVDGDKAYYMIQQYTSKDACEGKFETHKRYIDIQIVLDGEEQIRFDTLDTLTPMSEYDSSKDCALYHMNSSYDSVNLRKGELAIIFPDEAHAPGLSVGNSPSTVRKMVAKVAY